MLFEAKLYSVGCLRVRVWGIYKYEICRMGIGILVSDLFSQKNSQDSHFIHSFGYNNITLAILFMTLRSKIPNKNKLVVSIAC